MLTLGIETSGSPGSIALLRDGEPLAEKRLEQPGVRHATNLVSEINALLQSRSLRWRDVDLIAISIGPGSFTGLRVGVVCAKTAAYATGRAVVGVDSFLAIAENAPSDVDSLLVISDALRGDVYAGEYHRGAVGGFQRQGAVRLENAEQLLASLPENMAIAGPGVIKYRASFSSRVRVLEPEAGIPQAFTIARLGERIVRESGPGDLWTLEPLYLRKSAAEEKAEAESPIPPPSAP